MAEFRRGDAVWIDDGYAGTPHAAVITDISDGTLWAESPHRLPGDSRVVQWQIEPDLVAEMVTAR